MPTPPRKDYRRPNCNACQTVTALLATRGVAMETPPHTPPQLACLHAQLPLTEMKACHVKKTAKTHKLTRRKVVLPVHLRCRTLRAERPVQLSTVLNSSPLSTYQPSVILTAASAWRGGMPATLGGVKRQLRLLSWILTQYFGSSIHRSFSGSSA